MPISLVQIYFVNCYSTHPSLKSFDIEHSATQLLAMYSQRQFKIRELHPADKKCQRKKISVPSRSRYQKPAYIHSFFLVQFLVSLVTFCGSPAQVVRPQSGPAQCEVPVRVVCLIWRRPGARALPGSGCCGC